MTLLVDPPLLLAGGYALGQHIESERIARGAAVALAGAVLVPSAMTYLNRPVMRPVWERLGGRTGRDLILNSWVLSFDPDLPSRLRGATVAAIFTSYPAWSVIGVRLGRRRSRSSGAAATPAST